MEKQIEVKVTTKHFRDCNEYTDPHKCPLALAVKDAVKDADGVSISIGSVTIFRNGQEDNFDVTDNWCSVQEIYGGKWKGVSIQEMINAAKADKTLKIPTKILIINFKNTRPSTSRVWF